MNIQELFRDIQKGTFLPLYYFWGPEKWLISDALRRMEERLLISATREFNREVLDGEDTEPEAIVPILQSFPLRSPHRLVIVRRAEGIWKKKTSSILLEYFSDPNPKTCAVFLGEKADQRTKFLQALEAKGAIVAFYPPFEKDLFRWVHSRADQLGHPISDQAVYLLLERIGFGLQELQAELEKLILRKEPGSRIEEEDVFAATEDTRAGNPFELPPAVGRLDAQGALKQLRRETQQGDPPVFLFSLIVRHFRLLRRAKDLLARGHSKREIEGRLRIFTRGARDFWEQVERFPLPLLEQLWPMTLKTDRNLKLSRAEKSLLLEAYVIGILLKSRESLKRRGDHLIR